MNHSKSAVKSDACSRHGWRTFRSGRDSPYKAKLTEIRTRKNSDFGQRSMCELLFWIRRMVLFILIEGFSLNVNIDFRKSYMKFTYKRDLNVYRKHRSHSSPVIWCEADQSRFRLEILLMHDLL